MSDEELSGATKREGPASSRPERKRDDKLTRGTLVGRYVVVDVLGEGGMGVVYTAYDPELDRKVAIKLLQAQTGEGSGSHGGQAWLVREAQALAKVSHPNVIAVHDVGVLPGDRVFVAIELVEGVTLRSWMKQPRGWREVRQVMRQAGAGLAAAHEAGLIHRDFKPDNVLVGNDGRVRVMDFGLARLTPTHEEAARTSDLEIETRSPLGDSLTIAGSVVGTPAYMAPELFDGIAASAGSDQFALGVTLYEALFRVRPYERDALKPPRPAELRPRDPPKSDVPSRLARIAMQAIALDPAARFPSVAAMLRELAIDPLRARRRALYGIAAAVAIGGVIGATSKLTGASAQPVDRDLLCKGAERHLEGVWDAGVKQRIKAAFDATDKPFKATAFGALQTTLDRYATDWVAAVTDSCEATQLRGTQTQDTMSLRTECFEQRRAVFGSFARLLEKADETLVEKAANAALTFESSERIAQCADIAALRAPNQPPAELRPVYEQARAKLAEANAAMIAGNIGRTVNLANEVLKTSDRLDGIAAEGHLLRGMTLMQVGNGREAVPELGEAIWAAIRGKRDAIAARAALFAAVASTELNGNPSEALLWLQIGKASVARTNGDRTLRLDELEAEGVVRASNNDLTGAVKAHEQALELVRQLHGDTSWHLPRTEANLAATLQRVGDHARACPHLRHALGMMIPRLGNQHPDLAVLHSNLATCLHYSGDLAGSHAEFDIALSIRETTFGPTSPVLIPTLNNMADLDRDEGNATRAMASILRAKTLCERSLGKNNPYYVVVMTTYGETLLLSHEVGKARAALDEAVAIGERTKSPFLGTALTSRATLSRAERKWAESAAFDQRAIDAFTASSKDNADQWRPLTGLAIAKLELGDRAAAKALLDRALEIATKARIPERDLTQLRATLARLPKQ